MKKTLFIGLVAALLISMCACGNGETAETTAAGTEAATVAGTEAAAEETTVAAAAEETTVAA